MGLITGLNGRDGGPHGLTRFTKFGGHLGGAFGMGHHQIGGLAFELLAGLGRIGQALQGLKFSNQPQRQQQPAGWFQERRICDTEMAQMFRHLERGGGHAVLPELVGPQQIRTFKQVMGLWCGGLFHAEFGLLDRVFEAAFFKQLFNLVSQATGGRLRP